MFTRYWQSCLRCLVYALLAVPNSRNFACRRSVGLRVGVMLWMTPFFFESSKREALSGDSWVGVGVGVSMVLVLLILMCMSEKDEGMEDGLIGK